MSIIRDGVDVTDEITAGARCKAITEKMNSGYYLTVIRYLEAARQALENQPRP